MASNVTFVVDKQGEAWHVRVQGAGDWRGYLDVVRKIIDQVQGTECQRVLLDTRAFEVHLTTLDRYQLATAAAAEWDRRVAGAVLAAPDQLDVTRFGQSVAQNRGLSIEIFTDEPSALRWLSGGTGKEK